jgi:hypothetical protein
MRMIKTLPLLAAMSLAACGGGEEAASQADGMSADAVAEQAASVALEPGQYTANVQISAFSVGGATPDEVNQMRGNLEAGMASGVSYCVSEEDAEASVRQMAQGIADSNQCSFESFSISGNQLTSRMACNLEGGISAQLSLAGTVDATSSSLQMETSQTVPGAPGDGTIQFSAKVDSNRTGECS